MAEHAAPQGSGGEWAADRMLGAALWAARQLPYARRIPAFGGLARIALNRVGRFRERIDTNLDHVWPKLPQPARTRVRGEVLDNVGRVLIEHFSLAELNERLQHEAPTGDGVDAVRAAASRGQPMVFVSGHFGNYEAAWLCLKQMGLPIGGFYRPLSNPYINQRYERAMDSMAPDAMFAQSRKGLAQIGRHLKSGGCAAFLCDIYAGNGVEMPFLGRPALTALTAAEFAIRANALFVPFYGIRRENGLDFDVLLERPIEASDALEMMRAFHVSLEQRITAQPGQWMWMHRRWKRKWNRGEGMHEALHPAELPRRKSR